MVFWPFGMYPYVNGSVWNIIPIICLVHWTAPPYFLLAFCFLCLLYLKKRGMSREKNKKIKIGLFKLDKKNKMNK